MNTQEFPMIYVEWVDSCHSTSKWELLSDLAPLMAKRVKSVGFLINETKTEIRLCDSYSFANTDDKDPFVVGAWEIPKCAITKRRRLK